MKACEVALAFPVSVPWMAHCVQGITEYARQQGTWRLTTSPPTLAGVEEQGLTPAMLGNWTGDGVIAVINDPVAARAARRLSIPVVNLAGVLRKCCLPRVMVDQAALGRMAADHLLECRLRRLAYCGLRGPWYSHVRQQAFVARAAEAGAVCSVCEMPRLSVRRSWRQRTDLLRSWLRRLVTPVGILAVHDYRARIVLDECKRLGMAVPEDVAILGVDNDLTVCETCEPTLSSVCRSSWAVGYRAAALLDALMAGKPPPDGDILVPPSGIAVRKSTDTVTAEDPCVREAIHFMQSRLGEAFRIEQVSDHIAVSRRLLEKRFRQDLDCSPHEFLQRMRIRQARHLLDSPTKKKLSVVAAACGFLDARRFCLAFKREMKMTPSEYRRQRCPSDGRSHWDASTKRRLGNEDIPRLFGAELGP
ncbi:MAG: substrate-binding domain-containing protein [Thermoguttaceae bacterium]